MEVSSFKFDIFANLTMHLADNIYKVEWRCLLTDVLKKLLQKFP